MPKEYKVRLTEYTLNQIIGIRLGEFNFIFNPFGIAFPSSNTILLFLS